MISKEESEAKNNLNVNNPNSEIPIREAEPGEKSELEKNPQLHAELVEQQLNMIKDEIEKDCPLVSDIISIEELQNEFKNHEIFSLKINKLKEKYTQYRRIRRDGSCFYRACLFRIFEHICEKNDLGLYEQFKKTIENSKEDMLKLGLDKMIIEEFQEVLLDKLEMVSKKEFTIPELMSIYDDKRTSDYLVMYFRLLTSTSLKINEILYEPFLDLGMTIDTFCQREVDPIDKEADQIQIMALINYISIPIEIWYIDASTSTFEPTNFKMPDNAEEKEIVATLLYRPGHYDILYK